MVSSKKLLIVILSIILFVTIFILLFICINNVNSNTKLIAKNNTDNISARSSQSKLIAQNASNNSSIKDVLTSMPPTTTPIDAGCYIMRIPDKNGMYPPWLPGNGIPNKNPVSSSYLENVKTMTNPDPVWIEDWQKIPSSPNESACSAKIRDTGLWFARHRALWPLSNNKSVFVSSTGKAPIHGVYDFTQDSMDSENYRLPTTGWGGG